MFEADHVFCYNTSEGTILLYISKCTYIVKVFIPLWMHTVDFRGTQKKNTHTQKKKQFFLKKLYGADADISACTVDGDGTAYGDLRPSVTAFDGAIRIVGTIVVSMGSVGGYFIDRVRRQRR